MLSLAIFFVAVSAICGQEIVRDLRYNRYVPPVAYAPPAAYVGPDQYYNRAYRYGGNYVDENVARREERLRLANDESPKPYAFNYNAPSDVGPGSSSRTETADGSGRVEGSYTLTNEEGHSRVVEYVADEDGFRANIKTDEPGTSNQSPASVNMESAAPAVNYYRPEIRQQIPVRPIVSRVEEPIPYVPEDPIAPVEVPFNEQPINAARRFYRRPQQYYAGRPLPVRNYQGYRPAPIVPHY